MLVTPCASTSTCTASKIVEAAPNLAEEPIPMQLEEEPISMHPSDPEGREKCQTEVVSSAKSRKSLQPDCAKCGELHDKVRRLQKKCSKIQKRLDMSVSV